MDEVGHYDLENFFDIVRVRLKLDEFNEDMSTMFIAGKFNCLLSYHWNKS